MQLWNILVTTLLLVSGSALFAKEERTLALIKPNAVAAHHIGAVLNHFEGKGLSVAGLKMIQLADAEARRFYAIHQERPFFGDLVRYMSEGPIVAIVIQGDEAVQRTRTLIGATDPKQAAAGTLRALFGESITRNALHSSDSAANAANEIAFFFAEKELALPPAAVAPKTVN
jgi:nucleoside-diphosphate kinase